MTMAKVLAFTLVAGPTLVTVTTTTVNDFALIQANNGSLTSDFDKVLCICVKITGRISCSASVVSKWVFNYSRTCNISTNMVQ